jgi:hypothetical protein
MRKIAVNLILLGLVTSTLIACSSASKDIVPLYINPMQYSNYDCDQLRQELIRVNGRVSQMTGRLDKNRENDNLTTTASIILFWPAIFFIGGTKEQEAEFGRLKGESQALEQAFIQSKCEYSGGAVRSTADSKLSIEDRLARLKSLYDKKLIDEQQYNNQVKSILSSVK